MVSTDELFCIDFSSNYLYLAYTQTHQMLKCLRAGKMGGGGAVYLFKNDPSSSEQNDFGEKRC